MDIIKSAIKCVNCSNILSSPIILPCGHSICKSHTNNGGKIMCRICGQKYAKKFCYPNQALSAMLEAQIGTFEFGQCHKEAMRSCEQLNDLIARVDVLLNDPECYIYEKFSEMRRQVDLKREEIKLKVDEEAERVLAEINKFESECKNKLKSSDNSFVLKKLVNERESAQHQLDAYLSSLNELKFDDTKGKNIKKECNEDIENLKEMLFDFNYTFSVYNIDFKACNLEFFSSIDIWFDSKILTSDNMQRDLAELCEFVPETKFRLLYRGSRDGFRARDFHDKCDDKPKTITIIKSTNKNIFGGYTDVVWARNDKIPKRDPNAFLFSLVNKDNEPIKMRIDEDKMDFATMSYAGCGPIFGGPDVNDCDIFVLDKCNLNTSHLSYFGSSFKHPRYEKGTNEAKSFLAGSHKFQVNEIEVFQIV